MSMNEDVIRQELNCWNAAMQECDKQLNALSEIVGSLCEKPLGDAIYGVMDAYTRQVADSIGWDYSALQDWCVSHEYGKKPMKIGLSGERLRTISSIDDLVDFIIDDLRIGEL